MSCRTLSQNMDFDCDYPVVGGVGSDIYLRLRRMGA